MSKVPSIATMTLTRLNFSEFVKNYNPGVWAWNGPYLLSNVLKPLCNISSILITEPVTSQFFHQKSATKSMSGNIFSRKDMQRRQLRD